MKKLLLASVAVTLLAAPAIAADAIVYADPAPAQPVAERFAYDWTGFYIGGFGGVATGDFDYAAGPLGGPDALFLDTSAGGAFGGVQAGYDWQVGSWVFGAVADIAKTNIDNSLSGTIPGIGTISAESELEYLGTVRARAGYAFDRALMYVHGGWAYGSTEQTLTATDASGATDSISSSSSRSGWTVGAGVEYAITDMISFGTEYAYTDLGNENVFESDLSALGAYVNEDVRFHTVKAAINFRF